jgi:lysophospholipid acyltransferase (LPLAT)-like uncharacterized protein
MDAILADHQGFILVFWHERLLSMVFLWPRKHRLTALQSTHVDGRIIAHTVNHFGVNTVWGSSNRGGASGLRKMKRILDEGGIPTITPDGPRGPARKTAMGPVALAHLAGKPILPVAWSVERCWRAGSWDRLMIPKPFTRGVFVVGDAIAPPASGGRDDLEDARLALDAALDRVTAEADALTGQPPLDTAS